MRIKIIMPETIFLGPYETVSDDVMKLAIEKKLKDDGIGVAFIKSDKVSDKIKEAGKVVEVEKKEGGGLLVTIDITHAGVANELSKKVPEKIGISVWDDKTKMKMFPPKHGGACPVRIVGR